MVKANSPNCIYCLFVLDEVEHTFLRSPHLERPRLDATRAMGVFNVDTVFEKIMEGEDN